MRDTRPVWTVQDFLSKVERINSEWIHEDEGRDADWLPWFRGEANAKWVTLLRPRLYRKPARTNTHTKQLLYADQEIRLDFRRRAGQYVPGRALSEWEQYFLMQAYGAPTRLLDWTDGALTALYFAVQARRPENDREGDADAAVYMLDPWWLNYKTFRKSKPPRPEGVALSDWDEAYRFLPLDEFKSERLRPKIPLAIDPVHLASRMSAQRAHFTIFGRDLDGLVTCSSHPKSRLVRLRIPHGATATIKDQLKVSGISEAMLFPDIEGLGRELSLFWEELVRDIH